MKYGIWRHENALGNGAEHVLNLAGYLARNPDPTPEIHVENDWQRCMAMCIPGITKDHIKPFDDLPSMDIAAPTWEGYKRKSLEHIRMPGVYDWLSVYPAGWKNLPSYSDVTLTFPEDYSSHHELPKNAIVITLRERGKHWKRMDGYGDAEPRRFVNIGPFHKIALHYANAGHTVVRIGSREETDFPSHDNILDFAKRENRTLMDDLFMIYNSRLFLTSDSGIWPMAVGMKKKMVFSNCACPDYVQWLPKDISRLIFKGGALDQDNSFEEIRDAMDSLL